MKSENSTYPPPAKFAGFVGFLGSLIGAAMPTYVVWELYSIVLENSKGTARNTIQLADRKTFMSDATNTHMRHDEEIKQLKVDLARFDTKIHYIELRITPQ
jgi:hypothetical protein